MYNTQDLINAVKSKIEAIIEYYSNDEEIQYVDIRLQLVDGTYYLHFGDSSYDTDHRGHWGYGSVILQENISTELTPYFVNCIHTEEEIEELAKEIVNEALDSYFGE